MKAVFEKSNYFNIRVIKVKSFDGFPLMFHPHCEMIYVTSGKIDMTIDGHEHTLSEGEISITFPYVTHSYERAPDAEAFIILFDPCVTGPYESSLMTKRPNFPFTDKISHILPILERIQGFMKSKEPSQVTVAISYLSAIVGEALSVMELSEAVVDTQNISHQILTYCSEHFADDDISIGKISEALFVSPSYVSKVFSNRFKYRFREYINVLRINHAKKLISERDMKIVDVMFECGFKNQSSFNRVFLDICGVSPSRYKKLELEKK